jgi:hypothetical protein
VEGEKEAILQPMRMKKEERQKRRKRASVKSFQSKSFGRCSAPFATGNGMKVTPRTQQLRTRPAKASMAPCHVNSSMSTLASGPMTNMPTPEPHVAMPAARARRRSK